MVQVRAVGAQIGAEVSDIDLKSISDDEFAALYQAWLERNVLVIHGQDLEIQDFLRYSRRFGVLEPHPSKSTRHPDYPEITMLGANKFNDDGTLNMAIYRRGAEGWHTDGAYDAVPFKATQLYAVAIPSRGGDTLFASMYAAYNALPQPLKERLEDKQGAFIYGGREKRAALLNPEDRESGRQSSIRSSARTLKRDAKRCISILARSCASRAWSQVKATRSSTN